MQRHVCCVGLVWEVLNLFNLYILYILYCLARLYILYILYCLARFTSLIETKRDKTLIQDQLPL